MIWALPEAEEIATAELLSFGPAFDCKFYSDPQSPYRAAAADDGNAVQARKEGRQCVQWNSNRGRSLL